MGCCLSCSKMPVFGALLWKNWTLKKKRRKSSCCEILVPVLFLLLVMMLKSLTQIEDIPEGWTEDFISSCPYTDRNATSDLVKVPCEVPYQKFLIKTATMTETINYIRGGDRRHPFAKLFLAHSGNDSEREALDQFIDFMETEGVASLGTVPGFREMTFMIGDGTTEPLEEYLTSRDYGNPFSESNPETVAVVIFNKIDFSKAQFDYTLRLNGTQAPFFEVDDVPAEATDPLEQAIRFQPNDDFFDEGFISLQLMIDSFFIAKSYDTYTAFPLDRSVDADEINKERKIFQPGEVDGLPYPIREFTRDIFFVLVEDLLPLVFVLVFLMPVSQIIAVILLEKEVRAKEMLRLMGVSDSKIIFSWYATYTAFFSGLGFFVTLSSILLFPSTSEAAGGMSLAIFMIMFVYGISIISYSFLISTFFRKAFNGIVVGLMLYIILFFLYYSFEAMQDLPTMSLAIPQVAMAFTIKTLAIFERQGIGASGGLLSVNVEGFNIQRGISWLLFDAFYITLLAFYFNAVIPGEFGTALPFYFPLTKSFWKKQFEIYFSPSKQNITDDSVGTEYDQVVSGEKIEDPTATMKLQLKQNQGIQIRGLRKVFSTPDGPKVAVDKLNLDVFEGQILVLLGHNGAGKTTVLQMLSGMLPVTKGGARIYGHKLKGDIADIRRSLGYCPQHDVLYDQLTVKDHLTFYGIIKGIKKADLPDEIHKSVQQVGLLEKLNVAAKNLSGGMKRKLSLGISLIGSSKVVFVDEPTSGVDAFSRRSMWEVLQRCREGRVIILTTHFMDEADLLGDRIAIMAEGSLQCVGSSMYLKQLYGAGYSLTFVKKSGCDSNQINEIVSEFVTGSKITSDIGTELTFYLPLSQLPHFASLFADLDERIHSSSIQVSSYGISVTTMEEVFLKAGQSEDLLKGIEKNEPAEKKTDDLKMKKENPDESEDLPRQNTWLESAFMRQLLALIKKRANYARRDSYSFVCNTLVPATIFAFGLMVLTFAPFFESDPPQLLSVDLWNTDFDQRGFLPILELTLEGGLEFDNGRISQPGNFPNIILEQAFENRTSVPSDLRTVFTMEYLNGKATDCRTFRCRRGFTNEVANAILDFGDALIHPTPLFEEQIEKRIGASNYASVIIQPEIITPEKGICFRASVSVDPEDFSLNVGGGDVRCSDPDSPCLMVEADVEFGENKFFTCLPLGCLSDFDIGDVESLFGLIGSAGVDEAQIEEQLESTSFFFCEGDFCNSPPNSLNDFSVCRAGPSEPDPLCVVDELTELILELNIVENEVVSFEIEIDVNATYCTEREFTEDDFEILPDSGRELQESVSTCFDTNVSSTALDAVALISEISNLTLSSSFESETGACLDESRTCTFSVLPLSDASKICIVDSCVDSATRLSVLTESLGNDIGSLVNGFLQLTPNVACSDREQICDVTVDVVSLASFLDISSQENFLQRFIDSGLLTFFSDLLSSFGTLSRSLLSSSTFAAKKEVKGHLLNHFSKLNDLDVKFGSQRKLQNTSFTCTSLVDCSTISLDEACVVFECVEQIEEVVTATFGSTLGSVVIALGIVDQLNGVDCFDAFALENAGCSENNTFTFDEVDPDVLQEGLRNVSNLTDETINSIIEELGTIAQTLLVEVLSSGIDSISLESVLVALAAVDADEFEGLATAISAINFINVTSDQISDTIDLILPIFPALDLILDNPNLISSAIVSEVNALESSSTQCDSPTDSCLLSELSTQLGIICLPAGCSSSATEIESTFETLNDMALDLNADILFFTCNSTDCNTGCKSPSNCDSDDLFPVELNSTTLEFQINEDLCFDENIRYSYTLMINSTAFQAAGVMVNSVHTALLRRSLIEYFDFSDVSAFNGATIGTGAVSDVINGFEGGILGNPDVKFAFANDDVGPKITTRLHKLPFTATEQQSIQGFIAFTAAIFCLMAFAFIPGPMISYIVMEKEESVQIKHLQFVSGTGIIPYWLANYIFDLMSYSVPFILSLLLILVFDVKSFIENGAFKVVFIVFLGYGLAIIPFSYLVGHLFKKHTTALIWIIVINSITGLILMIASFAMDQIPESTEINGKLKWMYRLFPGFCLGDSLLQIAITSIFLNLLGDDDVEGFYSRDVAGANIVYLYVQSILFFGLVILIEFWKTKPGLKDRCIRFKKPKKNVNVDDAETSVDEDVLKEEERVLQSVQQSSIEGDEESGARDVLQMIELKKKYSNGKVAVKNVTLGVPEGECFGYLGINGAGKTTTMKCLTGDIFPTSGTGFIKGFNIVSDQHHVRQHVGYCSQFSSILGLLTVQEHLELFSNLKLVGNVSESVETLLARLSLMPFRNKLAKSLSGGNQRKLSVAIAMIGSPAVMLLDEPSTGMDVASRRFMWNVIENMTTGAYDGKKTSVILTTHSMEECEALCSRVAIMVGGTLRCLGSVQHLKSRFGTGFTLEIKMCFIKFEEIESILLKASAEVRNQTISEESAELIVTLFAEEEGDEAAAEFKRLVELEATEDSGGIVFSGTLVEKVIRHSRINTLKTFVDETFADMEVVEIHDYQVTFRVAKNEDTRLSSLFNAVEEKKNELHISEYAVSQTTLEQIFNGFAAQQEEDEA